MIAPTESPSIIARSVLDSSTMAAILPVSDMVAHSSPNVSMHLSLKLMLLSPFIEETCFLVARDGGGICGPPPPETRGWPEMFIPREPPAILEVCVVFEFIPGVPIPPPVPTPTVASI